MTNLSEKNYRLLKQLAKEPPWNKVDFLKAFQREMIRKKLWVPLSTSELHHSNKTTIAIERKKEERPWKEFLESLIRI